MPVCISMDSGSYAVSIAVWKEGECIETHFLSAMSGASDVEKILKLKSILTEFLIELYEKEEIQIASVERYSSWAKKRKAKLDLCLGSRSLCIGVAQDFCREIRDVDFDPNGALSSHLRSLRQGIREEVRHAVFIGECAGFAEYAR